MFFNYSHIVIFLLTLFTIFNSPHHFANAVKAPPKVYINKCCGIGERLDQQQCVAGSTERWWPLIRLMKQQKYFEPHGEAPRFMKARENVRPLCDNPEIHTDLTHAIFSNGSLYLSERALLLDTEKYCVDENVAIVCLPQEHKKLSKVKKCCGADTIFSAELSNCERIEDGSERIKRLVSNPSALDIVYGFPKCRSAEHYTVASVFHESYLDYDTGSLTLDSGRQFSWHEYCLEHTTNSINSPNASVITCMEHFSMFGTAVAVAPKMVSIKTLSFSVLI